VGENPWEFESPPAHPAPEQSTALGARMKIIYFLKNLRLSQAGISFVKRQTAKIRKLLKKEKEALVEVELAKDKEIKAKEGTYKTKIILDLPKKSLIVAKGVGKNIFQALNDGLKKLKRQLRRKP
jgi:ribosomal subunit interface protein